MFIKMWIVFFLPEIDCREYIKEKIVIQIVLCGLYMMM